MKRRNFLGLLASAAAMSVVKPVVAAHAFARAKMTFADLKNQDPDHSFLGL